MQSSARLSPAVREIPGRCDAEKALAASHRGSRLSFFFATVYLVDHVPELLEQGQWRLADRALMAGFEELARLSHPGDRIFRWTGSALLVLMERDGEAAAVRAELKRLPVHSRRRVYPLYRHSTPSELSRQIDHYVSTHLLTAAKIPA
ncbi:MAG: hypothetical protein GY953_19075 [bacterium]|nr:hypothetical protein [bacterium]